jgi:hypothetical protein
VWVRDAVQSNEHTALLMLKRLLLSWELLLRTQTLFHVIQSYLLLLLCAGQLLIDSSARSKSFQMT